MIIKSASELDGLNIANDNALNPCKEMMLRLRDDDQIQAISKYFENKLIKIQSKQQDK